ncbi:MAG: hypothetical protein II953_10815 [Clostridia bacterium]|nr:hypothetical protein [Clostridia bacterium]
MKKLIHTGTARPGFKGTIAVLAFCLLLASCGGNTEADPGEPADPTAKTAAVTAEATPEAPAEEDAAAEAEEPAGSEENAPEEANEPEAEEEQKPLSTEEAVAAAMTCIDKPVSALYDLIGEPGESDYAPSCFGDGEDGNLYYDGFTVYTYRENGEETVRDVE